LQQALYNAMRTLARRKLVILQPYSLTAYGLPMARHRVRLAENPSQEALWADLSHFQGWVRRGFRGVFVLETQLEPIVINPDSLVPPLDRAPILFYLLLLINTAVRMRLPDSEWSDVIIDLDGLDALGRLHFSRNGRPFMSIPLRILRHPEALE
jgi:hypothetical protein